jgi:hypothetical protein
MCRVWSPHLNFYVQFNGLTETLLDITPQQYILGAQDRSTKNHSQCRNGDSFSSWEKMREFLMSVGRQHDLSGHWSRTQNVWKRLCEKENRESQSYVGLQCFYQGMLVDLYEHERAIQKHYDDPHEIRPISEKKLLSWWYDSMRAYNALWEHIQSSYSSFSSSSSSTTECSSTVPKMLALNALNDLVLMHQLPPAMQGIRVRSLTQEKLLKQKQPKWDKDNDYSWGVGTRTSTANEICEKKGETHNKGDEITNTTDGDDSDINHCKNRSEQSRQSNKGEKTKQTLKEKKKDEKRSQRPRGKQQKNKVKEKKEDEEEKEEIENGERAYDDLEWDAQLAKSRFTILPPHSHRSPSWEANQPHSSEEKSTYFCIRLPRRIHAEQLSRGTELNEICLAPLGPYPVRGLHHFFPSSSSSFLSDDISDERAKNDSETVDKDNEGGVSHTVSISCPDYILAYDTNVSICNNYVDPLQQYADMAHACFGSLINCQTVVEQFPLGRFQRMLQKMCESVDDLMNLRHQIYHRRIFCKSFAYWENEACKRLMTNRTTTWRTKHVMTPGQLFQALVENIQHQQYATARHFPVDWQNWQSSLDELKNSVYQDRNRFPTLQSVADAVLDRARRYLRFMDVRKVKTRCRNRCQNGFSEKLRRFYRMMVEYYNREVLRVPDKRLPINPEWVYNHRMEMNELIEAEQRIYEYVCSLWLRYIQDCRIQWKLIWLVSLHSRDTSMIDRKNVYASLLTSLRSLDPCVVFSKLYQTDVPHKYRLYNRMTPIAAPRSSFYACHHHRYGNEQYNSHHSRDCHHTALYKQQQVQKQEQQQQQQKDENQDTGSRDDSTTFRVDIAGNKQENDLHNIAHEMHALEQENCIDVQKSYQEKAVQFTSDLVSPADCLTRGERLRFFIVDPAKENWQVLCATLRLSQLIMKWPTCWPSRRKTKEKEEEGNSKKNGLMLLLDLLYSTSRSDRWFSYIYCLFDINTWIAHTYSFVGSFSVWDERFDRYWPSHLCKNGNPHSPPFPTKGRVRGIPWWYCAKRFWSVVVGRAMESLCQGKGLCTDMTNGRQISIGISSLYTLACISLIGRLLRIDNGQFGKLLQKHPSSSPLRSYDKQLLSLFRRKNNCRFCNDQLFTSNDDNSKATSENDQQQSTMFGSISSVTTSSTVFSDSSSPHSSFKVELIPITQSKMTRTMGSEKHDPNTSPKADDSPFSFCTPTSSPSSSSSSAQCENHYTSDTAKWLFANCLTPLQQWCNDSAKKTESNRNTPQWKERRIISDVLHLCYHAIECEIGCPGTMNAKLLSTSHPHKFNIYQGRDTSKYTLVDTLITKEKEEEEEEDTEGKGERQTRNHRVSNLSQHYGCIPDTGCSSSYSSSPSVSSFSRNPTTMTATSSCTPCTDELHRHDTDNEGENRTKTTVSITSRSSLCLSLSSSSSSSSPPLPTPVSSSNSFDDVFPSPTSTAEGTPEGGKYSPGQPKFSSLHSGTILRKQIDVVTKTLRQLGYEYQLEKMRERKRERAKATCNQNNQGKVSQYTPQKRGATSVCLSESKTKPVARERQGLNRGTHDRANDFFGPSAIPSSYSSSGSVSSCTTPSLRPGLSVNARTQNEGVDDNDRWVLHQKFPWLFPKPKT